MKKSGIVSVSGWAGAIAAGPLVLGAASSSIAQEGEDQRRVGIEEVVVTAQRRAESLQSVPIAISAYSEEQLRTRRIDSLGGLADRTPGFAIGQFFPTQPQIYIRGIGSNDDGPAADPSTVVFIDEVYVGRAAGWTANLFDLERVEVLRGPQGTLYGKNVVGGAINLITRKPDENFRAQLSASVGNLDSRQFQGVLSGPIASNLYGKISFNEMSRDGYLDSKVGLFPDAFPSQDPLSLGQFEQLNKNSTGIRAGLRWLPSEDLEINFSVDSASLDENAPGFFRRGTADAQMLDGLLPQYVGDPRINLQDRPAQTTNETTGFNLRVDYELGWSTFTSISSYRESETLNTDCCSVYNEEEARLLASSPTAPAFGQLLLGTGNVTREDADQLSQEFRFTSAGSGPLQWVAGFYYLEENTDRTESFDYGIGFSDGAGGFDTFVPPTTGITTQFGQTESVAIFGQATWSITEKMRLTAGARWTEDTKKLRSIGQPGGFLVNEAFDVSVDESWDEVTPRFVLDYQLTEDIFLYTLASKGFKSGGFQGSPPRRINAAVPFEPEIAWLYEAGIKSEWFDRRAQVNLTGFYTDYTDLQVFQLLVPEDSPADAGVLVAQNAADAEVQGLELEITLMPISGLTLSASYAYLDATFSEFFPPAGFNTPSGVDPNQRAGNNLRNSPEHSGTLMAVYEMMLKDGKGLMFQLDWRYQDDAFQDPDNQEGAAIDAYDLLDARVAVTSSDSKWELALWAENLFDEDYFIHGFPSEQGGTMTPGPPRLYGLSLTWSM